MQFISISASAGITGFESPASEYKQLGLSLDDLLIKHPSSTFICKACGDSMNNLGIFNNDLLIVDRSAEAKNLDVIVANINGEFVCKLIDIKNKLLISANDYIQPVSILDHDNFSIEGVVINSIRCHRPLNFIAD